MHTCNTHTQTHASQDIHILQIRSENCRLLPCLEYSRPRQGCVLIFFEIPFAHAFIISLSILLLTHAARDYFSIINLIVWGIRRNPTIFFWCKFLVFRFSSLADLLVRQQTTMTTTTTETAIEDDDDIMTTKRRLDISISFGLSS